MAWTSQASSEKEEFCPRTPDRLPRRVTEPWRMGLNKLLEEAHGYSGNAFTGILHEPFTIRCPSVESQVKSTEDAWDFLRGRNWGEDCPGNHPEPLWDGMERKKSQKLLHIFPWAKLYENMFLYITRLECFLKEKVQVILYRIHDFNFMNHTSLLKTFFRGELHTK